MCVCVCVCVCVCTYIPSYHAFTLKSACNKFVYIYIYIYTYICTSKSTCGSIGWLARARTLFSSAITSSSVLASIDSPRLSVT